MTNDQKLLGSPSKGRVSKLILFDFVDDQLFLLIVRSKKYWTLYGGNALEDETPWQAMTREFIEESGVNLFDGDVIFAREQSSRGRIDIFVEHLDYGVIPPIAGEIIESKWISVSEIEKYTLGFWKFNMIVWPINEYIGLMTDCPICKKKVNQQHSYRTVYVGGEQYYLCSKHDEDEVDTFYTSKEHDLDLEVDEEDFDDDDSYILDMWGADAVNRRHNK